MCGVKIDQRNGIATTDFGDVLLTRETVAFYRTVPLTRSDEPDTAHECGRLWLLYEEVLTDFAEEEYTFEYGGCEPAPCISKLKIN